MKDKRPLTEDDWFDASYAFLLSFAFVLLILIVFT